MIKVVLVVEDSTVLVLMMKLDLGLKVLGQMVSSNLRLIVLDGKRYSERILYSRVKVERLDQQSLKIFIQMTQTKDVNIIDVGGYLGSNYQDHVPVFISKNDGLVYAQDTARQYCLEGVILLQKLHKFDLVLDYKRTQWHFNPNIVKGWTK